MGDGSGLSERDLGLDRNAAEEVLAQLEDWVPFAPATERPGGILAVASGEEAEMRMFDPGWMELVGGLLDQRRLDAWIAREEAAPDEDARGRIAMACEEVMERVEALVAAAVDRLPAWDDRDALRHQFASAFVNIACLRLLEGRDGEPFVDRCLECIRAGGLPCGWEGEYPQGDLIAWFPGERR